MKAPEVIDDGVMPVSSGAGLSNVTPLLPDALASAALKACTVTVPELGTLPGAVYRPEELIVPAEVLPPVTPFTCQVTEVFDDPLTVALNACVAPARTLAVLGETDIETPDGAGDEVDAPVLDATLVAPVHPVSAAPATKQNVKVHCRKSNFLNSRIPDHSK